MFQSCPRSLGNMQRLHFRENNEYGVAIYVKTPRGLMEEDDRVAYKAAKEIINDLWARTKLLDPQTKVAIEALKRQFRSYFKEPVVYIKQIPNEYCSQPCCFSRPWFMITTRIGHIKMGWRKRVISIDWSGTEVQAKAQDLFPTEDVTKLEKSIHAWTEEKAAEYLDKLHAAFTG